MAPSHDNEPTSSLTQPSNVPEFKVANIVSDAPILDEARQDAFHIVESDLQFSLPDHQRIADTLRRRCREALALMKVA